MNPATLAALLVVFPVVAAADIPGRDALMRYAADSGEKMWAAVGNHEPSSRQGVRDLFLYALALCEAKQHPERPPRLFELAARMQDRDPKSPGYGNFRWYWSNDKVTDYNAVDFCMQSGSLLWLRHRDEIAEPARAKLRELLEFAAEGLKRHRVPESYTNIALMNAGDLIILGEALGKPDVADEGYARLERACLSIWDIGIYEYDSPTYYGVDLDDLVLIEAFCQRERGRAQARALLQLFWTDIALNFFTPAQRLGGARSRDYDYLHGVGYLDTQLWLAGWLKSDKMMGSIGVVYPALGRWRPPESLRDRSAKFPRLVRQSWGLRANESRTAYIQPDIELSTAGANYHNMDIPLAVDFAAERTQPRLYFIPDGRHDPYGKIKIPEGKGPHEKTLHLKPFWTAAQRNGDALGLVVYRDPETVATYDTLESHIVMPRESDGFWIGDRRVEIKANEKFPVKPGETLTIRKGTTAAAVRVLWTRAADGKDATIEFVNDGNAYDAVRLTVTHKRAGGVIIKDAVPAAAFWVRVGSGLRGDEAFTKWRQKFQSAGADVDATAAHVHLLARGVDGQVIVGADAPFTGSPTLNPQPSRAVLEFNGEDIGRRIIKNVVPVKSLSAKGGLPAIALGKDARTIEAESGQVIAPMVVGKDPQASGGAYVWMPGEPGAPGGSNLASVTWRLSVTQPGRYWLWGRVLTPTSSDDSFFVRLFADTADFLGLAAWPLGVHKDWTWVRLALDDIPKPTPLDLPRGSINLQLRVREDGAKIDRLFITTDPKQEPR